MRRSTLVTLAALGALLVLLLWSTLSAQRARCNVCVEFGDGRNCATASAASRAEAQRSAQSTACGTLAHGMNDAIACDNRPPSSVQCTGR